MIDYMIARLVGRCADGAQRGGGTKTHVVPRGMWGTALCGATPGRRFSNGWDEVDGAETPTCPRCIAKAAKAVRLMSLELVRPFVVIDAPQRSPAWATARLGRLTGSRAADMLAMVKGGESVGRRTLRRQLALERVTGRSHERPFTSPAMRVGCTRELEAVAWYEALTGDLVRSTGFLASRTQPVGVSLDGHVGNYEGLLEIKCPQALTHVDYCAAGTLPGAHRKQIVHALWITGAAWCDWLSFNPEFPPALRAMVVRVERDEREIASYALAAALFLREVDAAVAELQCRNSAPTSIGGSAPEWPRADDLAPPAGRADATLT